MPGVVDVRFAEREPAEKRNLLLWEQVARLSIYLSAINPSDFAFCQLLFALRKTTAFCQRTCVISI